MRTTLLLLALSTLPFLPIAAADETRPDCEADQPWAGYARTEPVRDAYAANGSPGGLALCEGEHWDGQDGISSAEGSCSGSLSTDPQRLHAGFCLGPDPNARRGDDLLTPLGVRASAADGEAYAAAHVALAARVAVHADEGTAALYFRDDTPGNTVWQLRWIGSITGPPVSEADCDQERYAESQESGHGWMCPRDNTAVTLEHGLLA